MFVLALFVLALLLVAAMPAMAVRPLVPRLLLRVRVASAASGLAMLRQVGLGAPPPRFVLFARTRLEVVMALGAHIHGGAAQLAALRARLHELGVVAAIVCREVLAAEALAGGLQPAVDALAVPAVAVGFGGSSFVGLGDLGRGWRILLDRDAAGPLPAVAQAASLRAVVPDSLLPAPRWPVGAGEALASLLLPLPDALLILAYAGRLGDLRR
mmetsp:Transcript_107517/g.309522  ORF Transcript_107517/g.309522 Transcript_107517/m.309522 type:complete len:213 (+) Transcript_107517:219-857(+)